MIVEPSTDLASFVGARVTIDGVRTARITTIRHCQPGSRFPELRGGFGGTCVEDPHGDCRGGSTAFWWPYGTDVEVAA